ncbi:MAG: ATP-binding protein [Bryobacteraceae bacterium]
MLGRTAVKLWIERRSNRAGTGIRTKLVLGALALSIMPVSFLVVFSVNVINFNVSRWFTEPTRSVYENLVQVNVAFEREVEARAAAQAATLARSPETTAFLATGSRPVTWTRQLCQDLRIFDAYLRRADGATIDICATQDKSQAVPYLLSATQPVGTATLTVRATMPADLAATHRSIAEDIGRYSELAMHQKQIRGTYLQLLALITLFILFVATWIALFLAKQISGPISALLEAAAQLRKGNLNYRVRTPAIDELGTLVRGFNEMSAELEANEKELERRHNFTEAILESIPTGVISLSGERRIQRVNTALAQIFGVERLARATRLEDLFPPEDAKEIHYLLNRARRTGLASSQIDLERDRQVFHLAITVAALVGKHTSGWVVIVEDTSDLLRAQKSAAWHEVARRIAHELKNPLTPISLSAERIARQVDKAASNGLTPEIAAILRQCSRIITGEVESVKTLADAFSQLARFPEAQPQSSDLNAVVEEAVSVFADKLDGVDIRKDLAPGLPPVNIDREQFKRVVINLVDNAAEAMQESMLRRLTVRTQLVGTDTVELEVADTGHGISPEDRERLFLPYFSTKSRGTGLGLAIVHHILQDHGAQVRVEDNHPYGARFLIEIPAMVEAEAVR